jgi:predicted DNA-binding transcriptional regulator AlpA
MTPPPTRSISGIRVTEKERRMADARTVYLNAGQVRDRYGGISDMTLWRWLHDEKLGFPKPRHINRLRYWDDAELTEWEATCTAPLSMPRPKPPYELGVQRRAEQARNEVRQRLARGLRTAGGAQ